MHPLTVIALAAALLPSLACRVHTDGRTSSGHGAVSHTTYGFVEARATGGESDSLVYAILFRGLSGWHEAAPGTASSASGGGSAHHLAWHYEANGVTLDAEAFPDRGVVRVAGRELSIPTGAVVLVDGVGVPGPGPRVVGVLPIDARIPSGTGPLAHVLASDSVRRFIAGEAPRALRISRP